MPDQVILKKGGKLFAKKWEYDEEKDEGGHVYKDITSNAPYFLNEKLVLEDDVTLRDVFLLIREHQDFFDIFINNWVDEIVAEGLDNPPMLDTGEQRIDFLECYWHLAVDVKRGDMWGNRFPDFHGITLKKNSTEVETNWGLSFSPAYTLIDLPLKLNGEMNIWDDSLDRLDRKPEEWSLLKIKNPEYTLGGVLYGIIWELTWHGPPSDRDGRKDELDESIKCVKDGTAELIPWEDIEAKLRED